MESQEPTGGEVVGDPEYRISVLDHCHCAALFMSRVGTGFVVPTIPCFPAMVVGYVSALDQAFSMFENHTFMETTKTRKRHIGKKG